MSNRSQPWRPVAVAILVASASVAQDVQLTPASRAFLDRVDETNTELPAREHAGRGYKVPNGGIYSTAEDLCRLIAALTREEDALLSPEVMAEVQRRQTPGESGRGYGLGFFVDVAEDGTRTLSHGGSVLGYTAYWAFDPDARIGTAVLRNYNQGATRLNQVLRVVRELARNRPERRRVPR